jgi:hypothetical protein
MAPALRLARVQFGEPLFVEFIEEVDESRAQEGQENQGHTFAKEKEE